MKRYYTLLISAFLLAIVLPSSCRKAKDPDDNPPKEEDKTTVVESVSVYPTEVKIGVGKQVQLKATVVPEDTKDVSLVWTSEDTRVATVSQSGLVKGISDGKSKITVKAQDKSAECFVTVVGDPVQVISISVFPSMDLEEGKEYALQATILPVNATNKAVAWESSDPTVAFVKGQIVKAMAAGNAVLTARTMDGSNLTAQCAVKVRVRGPYNVIQYMSVDGKEVNPYSAAALGTVVSNEYGFDWGVLTLKDDLLKVGENAFKDCTLLTELVLPGKVAEIGPHAFNNCSGLLFINIPDDVTVIGKEAFYLCSSLTSITLPEGLQEVGLGAFSRCSSLGYIHSKLSSKDGRCLILNSKLTAFAPAGLSNYEISDDVTGIEDWAFKYCQELESITIPASVTEIGSYAFLNCKKLHSVILKGTTPPSLGEKVFENVSSLYKIYVPASALNAYKSAPGWSQLSSRIEASK